MHLNFLEFEQPIAEIQAKIQELRLVDHDPSVDINEEINRLKSKEAELTKNIFSALKPWQVVQIARHPTRPYTLDYIERIFTDFDELHGDRHFADDESIVAGIARLNGEPVMVIGHQKGRNTQDKITRNFGMPKPEGYRKALRVMKLAEKFNLPLITFIDTPGAFPGIDAEARGQAEAIAFNLKEMAGLRIPVVCLVIGEGGSGGALAIGVGDTLMMLEYSVYSVISPEGCAAILWKSAEKAADAAEAMRMTSKDALNFKLIDSILEEPLGGAHRDWDAMAKTIQTALFAELEKLKSLPTETLLEKRLAKLMAYGISGE